MTGGYGTLSFRALGAGTEETDGLVVRPVHPNTKRSQLPVRPGVPYGLDVELWNTAHYFAPGHRLRLTILANELAVLPTVPGTIRRTGVVTLHRDREHPSWLVAEFDPSPSTRRGPTRLQVSISPRIASAGRRSRHRLTVRAGIPGFRYRAAAADVRIGRVRVRTDSKGRATVRLRFNRPGRRRVRISTTEYLPTTTIVTVRHARRTPR